VAVLVNIADDHLDWHGGAEPYAADKARLWQAQRPSDTTVVFAGDDGAMRAVKAFPPPGKLITATVGDGVLDPQDLSAPGPHNAVNATLAAHACIAAGADPGGVRDVLRDFHTGGHRLEVVQRRDGVTWVDDSKATNPHAALAALQSFDDIIWIAGGLNKGLVFDSLADAIRSRVRHTLTIGRCGPQIAELSRAQGVPTQEVGDLRSAVQVARKLATPGTTVLLAPAAASMDQFENYAERGRVFADAVTVNPAVNPEDDA
jgi:UDP-N-acetylmuramoylalanine--D-glutamate ligase